MNILRDGKKKDSRNIFFFGGKMRRFDGLNIAVATYYPDAEYSSAAAQ
jgi:hypothetical protein